MVQIQSVFEVSEALIATQLIPESHRPVTPDNFFEALGFICEMEANTSFDIIRSSMTPFFKALYTRQFHNDALQIYRTAHPMPCIPWLRRPTFERRA